MRIREADADDFDAIWPIFREIVAAGDTYGFDPDTPREQAERLWMEIPRKTFVAEADGKILGTYYIKTNMDGPGSHVCNCGYMVASEARGRGIAAALCEHSQDIARELGYKAMQFNFVASSNAAAIHLWDKQGFETVGRLPRAFGHPVEGYVDALVMYKWLGDWAVATLNLQPTLVGDTITLRPLAASDFEALYEAASDPLIWEQHPDTERHRRDVFETRFFRSGLECGGTLVVLANDSGGIIGSSRFYEWDPSAREIAIGYTFLARSHWGGPTNTEMKRLMLSHAATAADWAWFHIGEDNLRSRRAVEKLGAELVRSENRELEGQPFVQLYYRLPLSGWRGQ